MSNATAKRDWNLGGLIIAPIHKLWQRDKTHVLIFVVVNLVAGQIGVLTSLALTLQAGGSVFQAYKQNISSGAFYTFAIALVVSSLALIWSEVIDAIRDTKTIRFFESKVVWSIFAAAVLVIQAPLAGALLSPSGTNASQEKDILEITWGAAEKNNAGSSCPSQKLTIVARGLTKSDATPGESESDCSVVKVNQDSNTIGNADSKNDENGFFNRSLTQLVFWILSMFIALELYCLYRLPLITDRYAAQRNSEVDDLLNKAEHQTQTSFGENLG